MMYRMSEEEDEEKDYDKPNQQKELAKKYYETSQDAVRRLKHQTQTLRKKINRIKNTSRSRIGRKARFGGKGELGTDLLFRIRPTAYGWILILRKIRNFTKTNIWRQLSLLVYLPAQTAITNRIKKIVPKDTGRLQNSLIMSISASGHDTNVEYVHLADMLFGFKVSIGTPNIYYARYVNAMPQDWLRHPGTHPSGRKGRLNKTLRDMTAEAQWYDKLVFFGRNAFKIRFRVFQKRMITILGGGQQGYNEFKKSFDVDFK